MNVREQAYNKFNSEDKLLQVEYGLEAVNSGYQIVSLLSEDSIVNVSKKLPKQPLSA
jgi:20S proteasome alpha/beta subunit